MKLRCNDLISFTRSLAKVSERQVGGKGWNLFRLRRFGFLTPAYWVVSSQLFDSVVGGRREAIDAVSTAIDFTSWAAVEDAAAQIQEQILQTELPAPFCRELFRLLNTMGVGATFAVRSSVPGEDSAANSFAGQMDSFLNIGAQQVPECIQKVWASAFSSRALLYRHRKSISLTEISVAVIIQDMVPSIASGVLFTREPESGARTCLISAAYGLGEGVTADVVKSDTYRIEWASDDISRLVPEKNGRVVPRRAGAGGTSTESLPAALRQKPVLTDLQIRRLRQAGLKAEKCFAAPQDIEWALDGRGRCWFLQARPIVFSKRSQGSPRLRIWDNSNIVESYPGLTLPLTFTFARKGYETTFRNATRGFLPFRRSLVGRLEIFNNMLGLIDGRVYYNLLNWYAMLSYLPGFKKHKKSWDQMIGVAQETDFPQTRLSLMDSICAFALLSWKLLTVKRTAKRFFAWFDPIYRRFDTLDLSRSSEDDLIHTYEAIARELAGKWHLTLDNDFCAMTYYDWIKKLCCRWGPAGRPNLHNDLLRGQPGMESVEPVRSLMRLTQAFREQPDARALIREADNHAILDRIRRERAFASLNAALDDHLKAFGDRTLEELKLENPSFRERPEFLIGMIKRYVELGASGNELEERERGIQSRTETLLRRYLRNPFKRIVFSFVLRNARLAVVNRENMRFARGRLFGLVRRIFQRMGDLFVEKGLLESASNIFYLTVDEVFDFVQGTAVTQNLKGLVELRKAEYARFAERQPPGRMRTQTIPYLSPVDEVETGKTTIKKATGIGCASGVAEGLARVVLDPRNASVANDRILVARSTDPGWVFLMASSRGIVVEKGSVLSHTAIIGRELGIPTVVGVEEATKRITDGARIVIDGSTGEVRWQ